MQERFSDIPHVESTKAAADDGISARICRHIRELRQSRGWSLDALSAKCSVSRSMISEIERNQANPTLAVANRIAQAFGMTLGELVDASDAEPRIEVVRADDARALYRSDDQVEIRTLSPLSLEKDVELYSIQFHPLGVLQSAAHFEGTREFLSVQTGELRITSAGDASIVGPGDSATYRADVPHAIENLGKTKAAIFLVVTYA